MLEIVSLTKCPRCLNQIHEGYGFRWCLYCPTIRYRNWLVINTSDKSYEITTSKYSIRIDCLGKIILFNDYLEIIALEGIEHPNLSLMTHDHIYDYIDALVIFS
jgi:hypothetical protein